MNAEAQSIYNKFNEFTTAKIDQEELLDWVAFNYKNVWKNEAPILSLDRALDVKGAVPSDHLYTFRILNVMISRHIASPLAISNTAYSAGTASTFNLKTALSYMVEALEAMLKVPDCSKSVMMYFRNIRVIFEQEIDPAFLADYENMFTVLVNVTLNLRKYDRNSTFIFECTFTLLHILYELQKISRDKELFSMTADAITEFIVPQLDAVQQQKILNKINIIR